MVSPSKKKKSPPTEEAAATKPPPPAPAPLPPAVIAAAAAAASGGSSTEPTEQQKQLAEFNAWLFRWNNYQQHLATYWQGRYNTLYAQTGGVPGGGKVKKGRKKKGEEGKADVKWTFRYNELLEFKEEHGHTDVPKQYTYKFTPPLGQWVGRQRALAKADKLDPNRKERLEEIGFEFELKKTDNVKFSVVWDTSYQALKAFKDVNGHIEIPQKYKPSLDSAELDGWITRQRKHFKDGKLPDHLKSKLIALGLNLGGRGRPFGIQSEDGWRMNYTALAEYAAENGDSDVPEKYDADRELGKWVKEQREAYTDGILPADRIALLNKVGFNFYHGRKTTATKKSDPWERRLSELKAYKEKTGTTNVPKKFSLNIGLGEFVFNQRMANKDKNLSEEKIKALEELGFDFTVRQTKKGKEKKTIWESRFDDLEEYKDKCGDLNIPNDYQPNPALSGWLRRQKKYHREGVLKSEKYERLKALGFNFGGPKQERRPWNEQYKALVEYKAEHGNLEVPVHYEPNSSLYYWIGTQRQSYKQGKLSDERFAQLQKLEFDFAVKPRDRTKKNVTRHGNKPFLDTEEWEKLFGELVEWKAKNGNCDVPQRSGRLGSWVHYMRFYVQSGKLSQEQIDRLNGIGFCWNVAEDRWMSKYQALTKFKAENGSFDMVASHPMYNWTTYQRRLYQEGSLSDDKVELLEKINFDFDKPVAERGGAAAKKDPLAWENRFKDLLAFKASNSHCKVPAVYAPNPALAKWAASQRTKYHKGNLASDKLDRLNGVDFDFGPQWPKSPNLGALKVPQTDTVNREAYLEDLWEKSYQELVAYEEHFGHTNIPISYDANPSLGAWAFSQRMAYKKGKLSPDRIEKLSELEFEFGPGKSEEQTEV